MIDQETMPIEFGTLTDDKLLAAGARCMVIQDCASDLNTDRKLEICHSKPKGFISQIRKSRPNLTAGDIELSAITQDVFDDIWPMEESVEHFYVPQERIDEIIIDQTTKHARRRIAVLTANAV